MKSPICLILGTLICTPAFGQTSAPSTAAQSGLPTSSANARETPENKQAAPVITPAIAIARGVAESNKVYKQSGINGAVERIKSCWRDFAKKKSPSVAEFCFGLDYSTSARDEQYNKSLGVGLAHMDDFLDNMAVAKRANDGMAVIGIEAPARSATIKEWVSLADNAMKPANGLSIARPSVTNPPAGLSAAQCGDPLSSEEIKNAPSQMLIIAWQRADRLMQLIPVEQAAGHPVDPVCYKVAAQAEMLRHVIPEQVQVEQLDIQMRALRGR